VHGERTVYDSPWVRLTLVDVEPPGHARFEHHVARLAAAAGCVVSDAERGVLLLYRHRFITDTWGWEIPAGRVDAGETPEQAAARETLEETGWRPGTLAPLVEFNTANGITDQRFYIYRSAGADHVGDPVDAFESERVAWHQWDDVRRLLADGAVPDGPSLLALSYVLAQATDPNGSTI
jgi:8-oxo-dGTP pyrophosphatase MutT (NUDIX family)